jgi:hypothetical protein
LRPSNAGSFNNEGSMSMTDQAQTESAPTDPWLFPRDKANAMATDKLAQMTKEYLEANRPKFDPVADRYQSKGHRIDRLVSGDPKERAHFEEALKAKAEADPVEVGMSGDLPEVPSSELRQMAVGAGWLRDIGVSEGAIKEMLSGRQAPHEEYEAVKRWKADALRNSEWTKRLLSGDQEAQRQLVLANIVLTNGVLEAA